ncbi:MAG: ATP-binding protein [Nanoarchaeota archaeon]|nr:ATP-binding protein [Nanoarchaeota archaeon]MBU4086975.1 ATP-binding protein [Nanoarchaeota archaeon]
MNLKCNLSNTDSPLKQIQDCIGIMNEIDKAELKNGEILNLDFSDVEWILPCSALLLSSKILESCRRISIKILPPNKKGVYEYLARIGFPLGCDIEGDTFLPINHFSNKDNVNENISKISKHIENKIDRNFGFSVNYLLAELSDNIEQHSQFTQASIMTQYYSNKKCIDIGIFDNGITIPALFEKKGFRFSDDCDAIKKAIEGVSTKEEQGRGFGLRTSKNLVLEGLNGEMYVLSRKGALILNPKDKEKNEELMEKALKGTLIYMRFSAPKKGLNIIEYVE